MTQITDKQLEEYNRQWVKWLKGLVDDLENFRIAQIEIMKEHDFKDFGSRPNDFEEFAGQSFLYALKKYYDDNYLCEANVQAARIILHHKPKEE